MSSRPKGKGAAMLIEAMRKHGYNKDIDVLLGKITSAPPAIKARPEGYTFELDAEDLVVAEHLTKHTRTVKIDGGAEVTIEFTDELKVGDLVVLTSANNGQQWYVDNKAVMY